MKKAFLISLCAIALYACTDEDILFQQEQVNHSSITNDTSPGRLIFSNKENLNDAINLLKQGYPLEMLQTRSSDGKAQLSNETNFRSLYEANKQAYFASLSPEEISIIENDEDGLEFCLPDSIVADFYFSQLLNEDRIVQIGDSVYKFYGNGIAVTHEDDADSLNNYNQAEFPGVNVGTNEDGMWSIHVTPEIDFIVPGNDDDSNGNTSIPNNNITLDNGTTLTSDKIRIVDYYSNGDGSWIHNAWNGLFGKNILAINKFDDKKRMVLSLYDLNYYIYAHIGTEVRMQKKVLGIWWNTKAQEIRQGWSAIELKNTMPLPIISYMPPNPMNEPATNLPELPDYIKEKFPFQDEEIVLLELPFASYDLTTKDLNALFRNAIATALNKGSSWLKDYINGLNNNEIGIYSANDNIMYYLCSADEKYAYNTGSISRDFYTQWFPINIEITFCWSDKISFWIDIDDAKYTDLSRGIVYGAVKYNNRWLGAMIYKL